MVDFFFWCFLEREGFAGWDVFVSAPLVLWCGQRKRKASAEYSREGEGYT